MWHQQAVSVKTQLSNNNNNIQKHLQVEHDNDFVVLKVEETFMPEIAFFYILDLLKHIITTTLKVENQIYQLRLRLKI